MAQSGNRIGNEAEVEEILSQGIRALLIRIGGWFTRRRRRAPVAGRETVLSGDRPLDDPSKDRLGYRTFASRLATAIARMTPVDGMVLAVYGPWGSGKSTVLNFITHFLRKLPESERPVLLPFNPWWFSGSENLVQAFLVELAKTVKPAGEVLRSMSLAAASTLDIIGSLPKAEAAKVLADKIRPDAPTLDELRAKADALLRDRDCTYVVVIDDIDRLTGDEIRQLFRAVKAIASLPRIVYLMAFDQGVVATALDKFHEGSGSDYLEKIVQVPFELPLPDRVSLRNLLTDRLGFVLAEIPESAHDQQYWGNVFFDGIDPLIETPRDITRLVNTLAVTFPAVRGEVNAVDFIAIEAIRVFAPTVFKVIRANPGAFTGTGVRVKDKDKDTEKAFHEGYIGQLPDSLREAFRQLLQRLFPRLQSVWGGPSLGDGFEESWRKKLRVCSAEVFPIYFRLELPEGAIGAQDVSSALTVAADASEFAKLLESMSEVKTTAGVTRAQLLLTRLEDFTREDIPKEHIKPILTALFQSADSLYRADPDPKGMFDFGVETQLGRVTYQLLRRLEPGERFAILTDLVNSGGSLSMVVREIMVLGQQHGKYGAGEGPDKDLLVSQADLKRLESLAAERIKREARTGTIWAAHDFAQVLRGWRDWGLPGDCDRWITEVRDEPRFIRALITSILSAGYSHAIGGFGGQADRVGRRIYRVDHEFLETFIDPESARPMVESLLKDGNLNERERLAFETFLTPPKTGFDYDE